LWKKYKIMKAHDIILKPIISEKSMKLVPSGTFTFAVSRYADKKIIKEAIEKAFSVHVVSVATTVVKGKKRRVGVRRTEKPDSVWKRAIVALKKGEKIGLFEPGES